MARATCVTGMYVSTCIMLWIRTCVMADLRDDRSHDNAGWGWSAWFHTWADVCTLGNDTVRLDVGYVTT